MWSTRTACLLLTVILGSTTQVSSVQGAAAASEACASAGQYCGNTNTGPNCCPSGEYCQPWNPWYYQCISQPAKCGVPETGVDYWGNDIADIPSLKLPEECCNLCADTVGCKAYTFVNAGWDGRTHCYLKSGTGTKKSISGAVSAVVTVPKLSSCTTKVGDSCGNKDSTTCCPYGSYCQPWNAGYYQCIARPAQCSTQLTDVDFYGNDLGVTFGLQPSACCDKCTKTSGCVAYTFVNTDSRGPACYLKSSIDGKRRSVGAVSGKVDLTSGSHIQAKIRRGEARSIAVNLGGWLVSEYWMSWSSPLWKNVPNDTAPHGELLVMKALTAAVGKTAATAQFEEHRKTWITEADIKEIAATGVLNTVRVPVGHWIVRDATTTPGTDDDIYARGGLYYLDKLINEWAVKYNLAVMLSLHAHQGGQNGYEHSSPTVFGEVGWSSSQVNVDNSLKFATFLAARYKDSPAFLGLNLMNEPRTPIDRNVMKKYYVDAYKQIRATGNNCIILISPIIYDQNPDGFKDLMSAPEYENVWNEIHTYFIWGFAGASEQWILNYLDTYKQENLDKESKSNRLFVGEWSMGGPPDETGIFQNLDNFHELGRKQLAIFNENVSGGWAFWSWRHSNEAQQRTGWSLRYLLRNNHLALV